MSRPGDEPLREAIVHAVPSPLEGAERATAAPAPDVLAALRRMTGEPALPGETLKAGVAADGEPAAAVTTAVHVATGQWLRSSPSWRCWLPHESGMLTVGCLEWSSAADDARGDAREPGPGGGRRPAARGAAGPRPTSAVPPDRPQHPAARHVPPGPRVPGR